MTPLITGGESPTLTCGRARVAAPRSTLGRTWRFDRPPRLSPAAFGFAYAFGRFFVCGRIVEPGNK